jgi:hypothetical protein
MRKRAVFLAVLAAAAATACSSGTAPKYALSGVWVMTIGGQAAVNTSYYQFSQTGSTVSGFAYGGVPRIGVCGLVQGTEVRLSFVGGGTFVGTFQDASDATGTLTGGGQSAAAALTATQDQLETGGGYPVC